MNEINKTSYIPLYGKAFVSKKNIILKDQTAEKIWDEVEFKLKRKSKSKWLAYFMAMRARVFDEWVLDKIKDKKGATVIHIGCGLDSRIKRLSLKNIKWYDVDFEEVINLRKKYFIEKENYKMVIGDASKTDWLSQIEDNDNAIILLEGISMYLSFNAINNLFSVLENKFVNINILMDVYTTFGVKMSKYKNPINDVGVKKVFGFDNPNSILDNTNIKFTNEHSLTPLKLVNELMGFEHKFFKIMFTGKFAKKMYKLYEYCK